MIQESDPDAEASEYVEEAAEVLADESADAAVVDEAIAADEHTTTAVSTSVNDWTRL